MATVLLIDDDSELLRAMAVGFAREGYQVLAAADGSAGLKSFKSNMPDIVVSDIVMPSCDGIETIHAIKKASPKAKVIAISGGYRIGPETFLTLAKHLGADDVLAKPFRLAELTERASRLLGMDRDPSAGPEQSPADTERRAQGG